MIDYQIYANGELFASVTARPYVLAIIRDALIEAYLGVIKFEVKIKPFTTSPR